MKSMTAAARNMFQCLICREDEHPTSSSSLINSLPAEILQHILKLLPTHQVMRCRAVCTHWREAVDELTDSDGYWRDICSRDHRHIYREARSKSAPSLTWRSLYMSLSLWSKLKSAKETWSELSPEDSTSAVHVWKGAIAAHTTDTVVYYDLESREEIREYNVGSFMDFQENEHFIVYLHYTDRNKNWLRELRIVAKVGNEPVYGSKVAQNNVNNFAIFDDKVFYNQWRQNPNRGLGPITEIYVCDAKDNFSCKFLQKLDRSVRIFGGTEDCLTYAANNGQIYSFTEGKFVLSEEDTDVSFFALNKYHLTGKANFIHTIMDSDGITRLSPFLPDTMHVYNHMTFVGTEYGILKIYNHYAFSRDWKVTPLRVYDLTEMFKLQEPNINGIDVLEVEDGHVVVISTRLKIMMLRLSHPGRT